jgi:hypothetical protein
MNTSTDNFIPDLEKKLLLYPNPPHFVMKVFYETKKQITITQTPVSTRVLFYRKDACGT